MHYFLISGEASGDLHGAGLIASLKKTDSDARFTFLGGDLMASEAGCSPLIHYRDMAFMGFSEVLRHSGKVLANLRNARRALAAQKPDCLILIDYPSFNLKVAKTAVKLGIPVYYYISPKIWAWKTWRVKSIRRLCRRVFCIFPFEPDFYASHGYDNAVYVGNPSVAEVDSALRQTVSDEKFRREHRFRPRPIIALMPGSRTGEIRNNLPVMSQAARQFPQYIPVIIGAPAIKDELYRSYCSLSDIHIIRAGSATETLAHCRAALVTSGTATLETALAGIPQVALYRGNGSKWTYRIMKKILKIPFVTLPNLIARRQVIPELLLNFCTAESAAETLIPLLREDSEERNAQIEGYRLIRRTLGTDNAADRTAAIITEDLRKR